MMLAAGSPAAAITPKRAVDIPGRTDENQTDAHIERAEHFIDGDPAPLVKHAKDRRRRPGAAGQSSPHNRRAAPEADFR